MADTSENTQRNLAAAIVLGSGTVTLGLADVAKATHQTYGGSSSQIGLLLVLAGAWMFLGGWIRSSSFWRELMKPPPAKATSSPATSEDSASEPDSAGDESEESEGADEAEEKPKRKTKKKKKSG